MFANTKYLTIKKNSFIMTPRQASAEYNEKNGIANVNGGTNMFTEAFIAGAIWQQRELMNKLGSSELRDKSFTEEMGALSKEGLTFNEADKSTYEAWFNIGWQSHYKEMLNKMEI